MTHQSNKHFNTYKEELDLEILRKYCLEHGEVRTFLRGEVLEREGGSSHRLGYIEKSCFKCHFSKKSEPKLRVSPSTTRDPS